MNDFPILNNIQSRPFLIPLRFLDRAHYQYVSDLIDQLKETLPHSNEFLTPEKLPAYHITSNSILLHS